jgi:hypothetical protein
MWRKGEAKCELKMFSWFSTCEPLGFGSVLCLEEAKLHGTNHEVRLRRFGNLANRHTTRNLANTSYCCGLYYYGVVSKLHALTDLQLGGSRLLLLPVHVIYCGRDGWKDR